MSYVITIERPQGPPLTEEEMLRALSSDADFASVESTIWRWQGAPPETELFINLSENKLWTDGGGGWTTESAIAKLQQLALRLNSRVLGEEGEDLTDASEPVKSGDSASAGAGVLLTLLLLPFVLLFALVRLPWVLWKITRKG